MSGLLNMHAFMMSCVAGLSTGLGGLMIIFYGKPSPKKLGYLTSFSAGVMVYISFMDLLPEAVAVVGYAEANVAFFIGMLLFGLLAQMVPDGHGHDHDEKHESSSEDEHDDSSASSGDQPTARTLRSRKSAPADKLAAKAKPTKEQKTEQKKKNEAAHLERVGIVTALSISLHNFPEGIAVYLACLKGMEVGFPIALAIAAHNIPEGMAVASPIYHSTGSKWQAFKYSLISGICEPVAALIFGTLLTNYITDYMVQLLLAGVAGIMVLVSLKELLPVALKYLSPEESIITNALGMIFISLSIYILHASGSHDHSHGEHSHDGHNHAHSHSHGHGHGHDHGHGHGHSHGHGHGHEHHHH